MSYLKDIEDILLAIQIKQSKYKYDFITEFIFNQKEKKIRKQYSIIKYHKQKMVVDVNLGKRKMVRIADDKVRGSLTSLLLYLSEEIQRTDDS